MSDLNIKVSAELDTTKAEQQLKEFINKEVNNHG